MEFEWDDNNLEHLGRHGITPAEVEELFQRATIRQRGGTDASDRFRVLGRTSAGRYLAIVYQLKGNSLVRLFTGWDMDPTERSLYERQTRHG